MQKIHILPKSSDFAIECTRKDNEDFCYISWKELQEKFSRYVFNRLIDWMNLERKLFIDGLLVKDVHDFLSLWKRKKI